MLFGGTGDRIDRLDDRVADGVILPDGETTDAGRNARDADVIAGDNADIIKLVGVNGIDVLVTDKDGEITGDEIDPADSDAYADLYETRFGLYLAYDYDINIGEFVDLSGTVANEHVGDTGYNGEGGERVVVRGVSQLDYTPGGPDYQSALFDLDTSIAEDKNAGLDPETDDLWRNTFGFWSLVDIGGADEVHGETGDDAIYLGGGNDIAFGDADNDDIIGGWGNDWISGGTGVDGLLGDDGRIFSSRNTGLSSDATSTSRVIPRVGQLRL